jgi:hypothetical protein
VGDRVSHYVSHMVVGKPVDDLAAATSRRDQARASQHLQVLRNQRLRRVQRSDQLVNTTRRVGEQIDEGEAHRRDQSLQQRGGRVVPGRIDAPDLGHLRIGPHMVIHANRPAHRDSNVRGCRGG